MTNHSIDLDGHFISLPNAGPTVPCPRVSAPCGGQTRYRYTWPATAAHRLHQGDDGPRLLVVGKNPSCPDRASNGTLRPILTLAADLHASAVAVVNILPVRMTDLRALTIDDVEQYALDGNRAVTTALVDWADIVIAAWGGTEPRDTRAREVMRGELAWAQQALSAHPDARQIGDAVHPYAWTLRRLGVNDLTRWPGGSSDLYDVQHNRALPGPGDTAAAA